MMVVAAQGVGRLVVVVVMMAAAVVVVAVSKPRCGLSGQSLSG